MESNIPITGVTPPVTPVSEVPSTSISHEEVTKFLEQAQSEKEQRLAQRQDLQRRVGDINQQDQELVKRLIALDGEILGYGKVLDNMK